MRQDWSHLPDGRWSQLIIYSWTNDDWVPQATNRFLWDGQVLLAVLNGSNLPEQTYLRGLDLSGTLQGAGGVGGLLAVNLGTNGTHFACFDGNGNVAALLNANSSTLTATYEYDPFGNTLRATGPAAEGNSLRFSTQFTDDLTRRVKYLYRDYDAGVGRWLNRDPIGEIGGININTFVGNNPIKDFDIFGLWRIKRDRLKNWATAEGEGPQDTLKTLALLLKLDEAEANLWAKSIGCNLYEIPNTAVVYTSRPRWFNLDGITSTAYQMRLASLNYGHQFEDMKCHVVWHDNQSSDSLFTGDWESDGIYAMVFAGHGNEHGYIADSSKSGSDANAIDPSNVSPPYKLRFVGAMACFTAHSYVVGANADGTLKTMRWRDHVSSLGSFVGFAGNITLLGSFLSGFDSIKLE